MTYITKENLVKGCIIASFVGLIGLLHAMFINGTVYELAKEGWILKPLFTISLIWQVACLIMSGLAIFYLKNSDKALKIIFISAIVFLLLLLKSKEAVDFIYALGHASSLKAFKHFDAKDVEQGLMFLNLAYIGIASFGFYQYRLTKKK